MSEAQKEYSKWLLKMLTIEITQQNFSLSMAWWGLEMGQPTPSPPLNASMIHPCKKCFTQQVSVKENSSGTS